MLRILAPCCLAALACAMPLPAGAGVGAGPFADSGRSITHRHHAGRFGRDCPCSRCVPPRHGRADGQVARRDRPVERPRGADSARSVVLRRHGDDCACTRCGDGRHGGRHGRDDGDTIVIVAPSNPGRAPGVLIRDRDSTRILLDAVSVEKPRRDDGVLAISESGGDVLVRGGQGPVVRRGGDPFIPGSRADRAVRTGSGDLYVHVRADGSLEIRRR